MKAQALCVFVVAGLVGSAAGGETPTRVDPSVGQVKHIAHIYYNIATGEKITMLMQDGVQSPADGTGFTEIWIADTGAQCADYGDTTAYYWEIDTWNSSSSTANSGWDTRDMFFDWGDIAMDTVVDCVQVHWITDHQDTDTDLDGVGDGVPGFAGLWIYYDALNGGDIYPLSIAMPLIALRFYNLPAEISDPNGDSLAYYSMDVDLGAISGGFHSSLIFEFADTDSDLQGASFHNPRMDLAYNGLPGIPDIDPDLDGLADWGWSLNFNQPGTVDVDNADGDSDSSTGIDGDPLNIAVAGVVVGSPTPGHPEYDSVADSWSWVSDGPTAGKTEDLFNTGTIDSVTSSVVLDGPWWFGGLSCTLDPDDPNDPGFVPAAHFQTVLYGPVCNCGGCSADLNQDGALDFFDISFFLTNLVDYNNDTVFDFFDISAYLSEYSAGCP